MFVRFTGMTLVNDVGQPTYDGPTEFAPDGAVLRTVAQFGTASRAWGWYIGFDGPGCVTLAPMLGACRQHRGARGVVLAGHGRRVDRRRSGFDRLRLALTT